MVETNESKFAPIAARLDLMDRGEVRDMGDALFDWRVLVLRHIVLGDVLPEFRVVLGVRFYESCCLSERISEQEYQRDLELWSRLAFKEDK